MYTKPSHPGAQIATPVCGLLAQELDRAVQDLIMQQVIVHQPHDQLLQLVGRELVPVGRPGIESSAPDIIIIIINIILPPGPWLLGQQAGETRLHHRALHLEDDGGSKEVMMMMMMMMMMTVDLEDGDVYCEGAGARDLGAVNRMTTMMMMRRKDISRHCTSFSGSLPTTWSYALSASTDMGTTRGGTARGGPRNDTSSSSTSTCDARDEH
jgi:hypothetical protein